MATPEPRGPVAAVVDQTDPCPKCGAALDSLRTCAACGFYAHLTAPQRIAQLADRATVDRIVPEQPAGHEAPDILATVLRQALIDELTGPGGSSIDTLLKRREAKFRHVHSLRARLHLLVRHQPSPPADAHAINE